MPLIDTIRIVCGKLRDECPFNNCGNCHACDAMRIDINTLNDKWLPAHDSAVATKAVKEFAEICEKLIELAEHGDYSNGNTDGVIDEGSVFAMNRLNELKDEVAHIRAMAEEGK